MPSRSRLPLDGQWYFWKDPDASLSTGALPEPGALQVAVPAPWQSQAPELRYYSGVGWYRRTVEIPADWLSGSNAAAEDGARCVILGFDAADFRADVWLNDDKLGAHEGGYLPFEFDVTHAARPGLNVLTVRVADEAELFSEISHGKQSWYGPISGLWQPVWVQSRPAAHLLRARATPRGEQVDVEVGLNRPMHPGECLTFDVFSPEGQVCGHGESPGTTATLHVPQPRLWDLDTPNLYTLRVGLRSGGAEVDAIEATFGFRTVESRDGQIVLNGRPIYLRSALDQDYYPDLIYTPPSREYIEAQFHQAKAMGLNCLRVHIKVADPRYYEAADRVGLLIWTELPNWQYLTAKSMERGRETLEQMIQRDWNHPSIVAWTIINEAWGTELASNPEHCEWLGQMYHWAKTLDPTRLVVDNSPCFPNFHVRTDIDDFHYYVAMPDDYARWDKWVRAFANRAAWIYAANAEAPDLVGDMLASRRGNNPLVVSEFGNWGLPDIEPLFKYDGGEPWWFETGWDWSQGSVNPHGAEMRFQALHLDKVFGDYTGLARASQWGQFEALKYQIETMRLYPSITGYVITEFTDAFWECNGLLDLLRNPKVYFDQLPSLNADTVIVPRSAQRAYWSGDALSVELYLSHFGSFRLEQVSLDWSLSGPGLPELRGRLGPFSAAPATVAPMGPLTLTVPDPGVPVSARLELALVDRNGAVRARNFLDLSLFPRAYAWSAPHAAPRTPVPALHCPGSAMAEAVSAIGYQATPRSTGHISVLTHLDAEDLRFLQQGGRALLLAEGPHVLEATIPRLKLSARENTPWQGDWVGVFAWYRRDRVAPYMPGDGRLDITFANIYPKAVITSASTNDYAHEVLAGMFAGWLRRPAALIQKFPVGRGTLLVSTLRLKEHLGTDPVATSVFHALVDELA